MKKIFTLLVALCTAFCAFADELTFGVEVQGSTVTVTPSADDVLYFCAAVDEETVEYFGELVGFDVTTPEHLFDIARVMYCDNLFTGVSTLTCHNGNHYLVMCAAEKDEEGFPVAIGEFSTQQITIDDGNDNPDPELEPLTFTVEFDNDSFTITPSDDVQEYVAVPIPPYVVEEMAQFNMSIEAGLEYGAATGEYFGHTNTGVSHHTLAEYANEGEEIPNGLYIIAIMGVKADVNRHYITTPIYQYEWLVDLSTTGISDIEAAAIASKLFKDGKFIINGRVNLNGTLVR